MRHVVVIFIALLLASCATGSTTTSGGSLKIVNLYPQFRDHMAGCTNVHGFDPATANVDENSLAPGEKPWRECVYQGIDRFIIGYSTVPRLYKQIVAEDRVMTEQIASGELTRTGRRSRLEFLIELIREEEINARDIMMMQAQDLNDFAMRQQELQEIQQMHNQATEAIRALRSMNLR